MKKNTQEGSRRPGPVFVFIWLYSRHGRGRLRRQPAPDAQEL
jgi:hypothetical protein